MNEHLVRGTLVALLLFNALTMIAGALFVVPYLSTDLILAGPLTDFEIPVIALGLVGVLSLGAAALVVSIPPLGALLAIAAGLATTIFEIVEVTVVGIALFESSVAWQAWLQPFTFTYGLVVATLAFALYRLHAEPRPASSRPAASHGAA